MNKRSDYGSDADLYFAKLDLELQPLALALRELILTKLPAANEVIKWGMPVYELKGAVCSIRSTKKYVALQFYSEGINLKDPDGLLDGTGKNCRHVKIYTMKDIKKRLFGNWIKQAGSSSK